jgi:hypothetical protein
MGKASRAKQSRPVAPRVIKQGDSERYNYARVSPTGLEINECIEVMLGNVIHHIHADTALMLRNRLTIALEEWDRRSREFGAPGLPHRDESESDYLANQKRYNEKIMSTYLGIEARFIPAESIPDDGKL